MKNKINKELIQEIETDYPELSKKVITLKELETEIKNALTNIVLGMHGETIVTCAEMSEIDKITQSQVRNRIETQYEVRQRNKNKTILLYARSSMKVQELYDYLKRNN